MDNLREEYFEWMTSLISDDKVFNPHLSYRKLLRYLDSIEYQPFTDMDTDRYEDGINFRYRFGLENGYSREDIEMYLGTEKCSMLEMMVAMAFRGEEQIMDDDDYGNRIGQWFYAMIVALGLNGLHDSTFDISFAEDRIFLFNQGMIPLFNVRNADVAGKPLWMQYMWYLSDILEY